MAAAIAFVDNTNMLTLSGLTSEDEAAVINNATVTVTVKDESDTAVSGETWPVTMDYITDSQGNYRAMISSTVEFEVGGKYTAVIDVDASDTSIERVAHWEFPFTAQVRKK